MNFLDLVGTQGAKWFDKWQALHQRLTAFTDTVEAALFGAGAASATVLTPATGAQALTLTRSTTFKAGMYRVESAADPTTRYMIGVLAADLLAGTALTLDVQLAAGGEAGDWGVYPLGGLLAAKLPASSRSATYTTTAADRNATILVSGTFTLSLGLIATLGVGHRNRVLNEGAGIVTEQRSGSNTVEGAASIDLKADEGIDIEAVSAGAWRVILSRGYGVPTGAASESAPGIAEIATQAETDTGTDDARIVTPLKLVTWIATRFQSPIDMADAVLQRPVLKDYGETLQAIGNTSTACTIDLTNGNAVSATLNGNCTFPFSNPPASGIHGSFILYLLNDATPGRTTIWPASVKWAGGSQPSRSTDADDMNIYTFFTKDGGTTWYGSLAVRDPS